jgi:uncharacterized protein YfdQ (DUF2303 family)
MIDRDTLKSLMQGEAIESALRALVEQGAPTGIFALPDNFKLHDAEPEMPTRRRVRGVMNTPSIDHFAGYVKSHAEHKATVFVSDMTAEAVLNLGDSDAPGHCDNRASLSLDRTADHTALLDVLNLSRSRGLSQRELAEFIEDWAPSIGCAGSDGYPIDTKFATDAVRRITIESARKVESQEQSLSAERSVMESVAATSGGGAPLPAFIAFTCIPYTGLSSRTFRMRLSIRTGDAARPALSLGLHLIRAEEHRQQMADELASLVRYALLGSTPEIPVYMGSYVAGR